MKREKLILICVAILAVAIIAPQIIKQNSLERQATAKLEQERQALQYQKDQDSKLALEKSINKTRLDECLADSETHYWDYAELNGTGNRVDGVKMSQYRWDVAEKNKKADQDNCYKRFNQ